MFGNTKLIVLRELWSSRLVERAFSGPAETRLVHAGAVPVRPFWRRGVFLVLSFLFAFGADAGEIDSKAQYVISLAGINVANIDVRFNR